MNGLISASLFGGAGKQLLTQCAALAAAQHVVCIAQASPILCHIWSNAADVPWGPPHKWFAPFIQVQGD
eukprot:6596942-Prorocentrum_lima.AAC.1